MFDAAAADPDRDLETSRSMAAVELAPVIDAEKETVTPADVSQSTSILSPNIVILSRYNIAVYFFRRCGHGQFCAAPCQIIAGYVGVGDV